MRHTRGHTRCDGVDNSPVTLGVDPQYVTRSGPRSPYGWQKELGSVYGQSAEDEGDAARKAKGNFSRTTVRQLFDTEMNTRRVLADIQRDAQQQWDECVGMCALITNKAQNHPAAGTS
jgi:hypothetical protein